MTGILDAYVQHQVDKWHTLTALVHDPLFWVGGLLVALFFFYWYR